MAFLTPAQWQTYMDTIYEAWDTFATEVITWRRMEHKLDLHGEDTPTTIAYTDTPIVGLIQYNSFRSWPTTQPTPSGEVDMENCVLLLSRKYLEDNGWLTTNGNLNINPGEDRFIHQGLSYKPAGETPVSGAYIHPLLVFVILKREETKTGERVYP